MNEIIQGSNEPITIDFPEDVSNARKIEVHLYNELRKLKHWSKEELLISESTVIAPLTENETMNFPNSSAKLEVKWKDANGNNKFSEIVSINIVSRKDKTSMED